MAREPSGPYRHSRKEARRIGIEGRNDTRLILLTAGLAVVGAVYGVETSYSALGAVVAAPIYGLLGVCIGTLLAFVLIWRMRPSMRSSTRVLDVGREKHIMARSAQPRSVASQAGSDPIGVRNVGAAETKSVRCAGLSLLVRPLSDRGRFSVEQEPKRCDPAGDWMWW
jgi:hypothetical protein